MPEYVNHNTYPVHMAGPDGRVVRLASHQRMVLSSFFEQYRNRGMIKLASEGTRLSAQANPAKSIVPTRRIQSRAPKTVDLPKQGISPDQPRRQIFEDAKRAIERRDSHAKNVSSAFAGKNPVPPRSLSVTSKPVVGAQIRGDATQELKDFLEANQFALSNDIGVGILSFNRVASLRRCVSSIVANTDLNKTTVFISDDGSSDSFTIAYLEELSKDPRFIVLKNDKRLGIAGNTNRLLRCLKRFKYALILNDDVSILNAGWDSFYFDAMVATGFKHFIHREPGIYGAQVGESVEEHGLQLTRVDDKPQGAILAFHTDCVKEAGYFDESYGLYGMEHVDWSTRVYEVGLQPAGYYDVYGSSKYFRLHAEQSAVDNRHSLLAVAREKFQKRSITISKPSDSTVVDAISIIVPYRELERNVSLNTVLSNLKALRVPEVEILLIEQDSSSRVNVVELDRIIHHLVPSGDKPLFNKSLAFNKGVQLASHSKILMHDADILACTTYGQDIADKFKSHGAFHIGHIVLYANQNGTDEINSLQKVKHVPCDRIVGYFEGGSLASTKAIYWSVGGFNEDFYGYGCEDCDFFARLASVPSFCNDRTHKFLHLWHPRAQNWCEHHDTNRALERKLCTLPIAERIKMLRSQVEKYAV